MLEKIVKKVIEQERITDQVEISLWMIEDEQEMAELNEKYRGVDDSTDVLSFAQFDPEELLDLIKDFYEGNYYWEENVPLGDVIISLPKVEKQAHEFGHTEQRELAFLFLHGLLHLLGYDHAEEQQEDKMKQRQDTILNELGINR